MKTKKETKVKITENRKPPPSRLVIVGENDQHPLSTNNQSNDKTKCDIHIPSINTRSLRTPEKLIELETEINEIKWDIVGISEMRRQGEGIEDYGNRMGSNRSKGRQTKRWEDDLKKVAGPLWLRTAKQRNEWKALEEAFVERQAVKRGEKTECRE
ncbi:hypothetical protein EVAR_51135_1 [Eumeta japonica]|uniref:Uncharacterized protein n=1 Tax=Eumeta variegata TaxID=151549 RepID=A0A4C1YNG2_EUMVA|nr:hypothetical protein EVAR_51135_1 [Eumeta japonica]